MISTKLDSEVSDFWPSVDLALNKTTIPAMQVAAEIRYQTQGIKFQPSSGTVTVDMSIGLKWCFV